MVSIWNIRREHETRLGVGASWSAVVWFNTCGYESHVWGIWQVACGRQKKKTIFWTEPNGQRIPQIKHILVHRRKDIGSDAKDEEEEDDNCDKDACMYDNDDYDTDQNMTFI